MATEAQINANRKNALKSTGPRTQEGKEIVSQNATKHGLCSCKNVIKSESQDEYNLFHDEMIADLSPVGAMELMLAERIVSLSWRLKRAEIYQNSVMDSIIDDRINEKWEETRNAREQAKEGDMSLIIGLAIRRDFADCRILDLLLMYERRIESSLYKATAELRKMQKLRINKQSQSSQEYRKTVAWPSLTGDTENRTKNKNADEEIQKCEVEDCRADFQSSRNDSETSHPQAALEAATQKKEMIEDRREMMDKSILVKQTQFDKNTEYRTQDTVI